MHPEKVPQLCELCGERPATVFITKIVDNASSKHCYCTRCATTQAQGQNWLSELAEQIGDARLVEDVQDAIEQFSFETFVSQMMEEDSNESESDDEAEFSNESLAPNDEDAALWDEDTDTDEASWVEDDPFDDQNFLSPLGEIGESTVRCPNCGTTWDRIKADGRAGCASCYNTFREQLSAVMGREQRGSQHVGKLPRAAEKRKRRLEQLRQRRDNQLQLLQNRLREAVAAEKYEEAAQLRDRIKIVASTIVNE